MRNQIPIILALLFILILGCSKDDNNEEPKADPDAKPENLYFPPNGSDAWETISLEELEWNTAAEQPLYDFLESKDTKAFLVLKDGKIAMEKYFGSFTKDSLWYWASAGKTLTAFTVGIAQEQGFLNIEDETSDYLGVGWTSATLEQENAITVRHQLTMSSGLNALFFDCVTPGCLQYKNDAGTQWAYHNGPYTLLQSVVANASGTAWDSYYGLELRNKIGMNGIWVPSGNRSVYFSNARSMARFGMLNLNDGKWDADTILSDMDYLDAMKNTSQDLNKSYGYLWWLNGRESHMGTGSQEVFDGWLIPNAPEDTYAGLGKDDQKLYIVPSKNLVVVRMGEDAGESQLGPSSFDNELWGKINAVIK